MRNVVRAVVVMMVLVVLAPVAAASPVAQTEEERDLYGRSFLEPLTSYNYIQIGEGGKGEFHGGMKLLAELYPRYLTYTTVQKEIGSKHAVSVGADGVPSWHPDDTGDGLPFHVAIVTDKRAPDKNKKYVALMASHQGETCGREGMYRTMEDLLIWATDDPEKTLDDATGLTGESNEMTVREILRKTKIYFISPSPDGWLAGDGPFGGHSQYNGAGINSNRVAYQDGWNFPPDPLLYNRGYTTLTQPEGAAVTEYLLRVRRKELKGKPFTVGMDVHGPVPLGFILLHDQGNDPQKLERVQDLGMRIRQNMEETMPPTIILDELLDILTEQARRLIPNVRQTGTTEKTAWRSSGLARWAFVTHIADSLSYTAGSTWGGWMNSRSGLDADSLSYEINCRPSIPWQPGDMQKYVDNVRAVFQTGIVVAAARSKQKPFREKVAGRIGFYESGKRVTDKDGNPMPPPRRYPNHPLLRQVRQKPYNVSNTDYFRDLRSLLSSNPIEVRDGALTSTLRRLDSFVVADTEVSNAGALRSFVRGGGNLVLTDSALRMLPKLVDIPRAEVARGWGYVGYSDLDRTHPFAHDLLVTARQMYDPSGLGYPLLMERDGYWSGGGEQDGSRTVNSAPMWLVERDAWEEAGGLTIGTADPPEDRKQTTEGTREDRTTIGILEMGKGRIVIFGALLPQPTERYPHWFGLNPYTVSAAGQKMIIRALDWKRP